MGVNIEWLAHACFRVWREGGPAIVMDPFTPQTLQVLGMPYNGRTPDGDVVIVSSLTDAAHGNPKLVKGNPRVINALDIALNGGEDSIDGSEIVALAAAESPTHPDGPKDNALYSVKVGSEWVMHLGDLGYGLTAEQLSIFTGRCDILLALTGGGLTISLTDLDFLINYLKPKWVIPMHYAVPPFIAGMLPLSDFITHRSNDPLFYARSSTIQLPLNIPGLRQPGIVVLKPSVYEPSAG